MRDLKTFRLVNKIEITMIYNSLIKISPNILSFFEKTDYRLSISLNDLEAKSKFPSIFLISEKQGILLEKVLKDVIVRSAGVYFGFIKKGNFFLSLEGLEFLYKSNLFSDLKRINVNDKGEKSILYGNNILRNMIIKIPTNTKQKDILVVLNKFDEVIAIAQSKHDHQNIQQLKPKDIIAINLNDKGYYLRRNQ